MLTRCSFMMSRWTSRLPPYLRRAVQADQMEMDSALSQMYSLCVNPSLVSKMSRARKMTKGHYYRDDPAFLVLLLAFVLVAAVAQWLLCFASVSLVGCLFRYVFAFVVSGLLMACVWRAVAVLYLSSASASAQSGDFIADYLRSDLDWRYAFDVHCNGYFTFFLWTEVVAYFLAPFMGVAWVGNAPVAVGVTTYLYSIFLGYLEIPSLSHQQRLLYPVLLVGVLYFLFSLLNINAGVTLWLVGTTTVRRSR